MGKVGRAEYKGLKDVGYQMGDYRGKMGLEQSFEEILRGSPGLTRRVVNAQGIKQEETERLIGDYRDVKPVPGRDLITTLDAGLMLAAAEKMEDYHSGAVAAVDPDNGRVLAMYSKPAFNPNSWSGSLSDIEKQRVDNNPFKPLLNKATSGYFPGSTFKIVGAAAALEEGIRTPSKTTWCPGFYRLGGQRFRCWKQVGHGHMDLPHAIQQSCDVYFYDVANDLGMDPLARYARKFGFGSQTGLILDSDSAGRIPDSEWHDENSPHGYQKGFALNMVLGQGNVLSTPLQMALAYAAIGNGGTLYRPKIIDKIQSRSGKVLFEFPPEKKKEIDISDETLGTLQKGLRMVVNEPGGTAYWRRPEDITVSGKTGTAQVHEIGRVRIPNKKKSVKLRDHAWFVAYAPSDDPEIAVAAFLEHAGHGGKHAGPVAMEVIKQYLDDREEKLVDVTLGDLNAGQ
jgi:penicillin-binding protein 2